VLLLENLSHDPERDYFADGMTNELIAALAKIGALRAHLKDVENGDDRWRPGDRFANRIGKKEAKRSGGYSFRP
jgi:hypothetical protein